MPSAPETKPEPPAGPSWLIRTARNQISGPWSREEVRAKVISGELQPQDEVCRANSYWIFLHEREEMLAQLGVEIPKTPGEEATQTETGAGKTSDTECEAPFAHDSDGGTSMLPGSGSTGASPGRPLTASPSARASSQAPFRTGSVNAVPPSVQVFGKIEKSSYWRGIAWFLLTSALVLVYLVLRALRTGTMKAPF